MTYVNKQGLGFVFPLLWKVCNVPYKCSTCLFLVTQTAYLFAQSSYIISPVCSIWLHKPIGPLWTSETFCPLKATNLCFFSQNTSHVFLSIDCSDSSSNSNLSSDYWNFSAQKSCPPSFDQSTSKMVPVLSFRCYSLML